MDYNDILFHIIRHQVNKPEDYVWQQLTEYLETHKEAVLQVAGEFLSCKGTTISDYKNFIKEAGHRGDKLAVYLLARMANLAIIVITKHGVWSTFDGSVNEADVVLVYLGRSVFCYTVPAKSIKHQFKVYDHEDRLLDPNQRCSRSMTGAKTTPTPIPIPTESEPKRKRKCRKRKPKVKIVKGKEFKIRRWQCTTWRCSLCPKKFKSTKELNDHISNEHDYKFLCKFHPCHKAYSSKLSADCHIHHHSPGRYQCDKCSKMFHEKYVLESHLNTHTGHGYKCTYPKCDRIYKLQAEYNWHLLTHTQPKEKVRCHVCDKAFDLKKYLDEHLKKHEDKLPEECPHCEKRFRWHSSLGIHIILKHPDLAPKKK